MGGMDVLVTGAAGRVGTAVVDHLADRPEYAFTLLDQTPHPNRDTVIADIADIASIRPAFEGVDAVVHLAGNADPNASWQSVLEANVIGTANVMQAASDAEVSQVVFASTTHAIWMYWEEAAATGLEAVADLEIDETAPPRPDTYYAVSKLFGEALGRYYVEQDIPPDRCYAVRIGWVLEADYDHPWGGAERAVEQGMVERGSPEYERLALLGQSTWCSRRDVARLVDTALQNRSVDYGVFVALSNSPYHWIDLGPTREQLGFAPADSVTDHEPPEIE